MKAAPDPDERVGQCLLEHTAVTMSGAAAENKAVMVALRLESGGGAFAGHDPVVMSLLGIFGAQIVLRDMSEDAQWFFLTLLDEFHARVIFPRAQRVFGLLRGIVILLIDERAGIGDDTTEQVRPKPRHRQRSRPARTAPPHGPSPRIPSQGEFWIGGFDLCIRKH